MRGHWNSRPAKPFPRGPTEPGGEYDLVEFAYYEQCGDKGCCGDLLAEAVGVGAELVARRGFAVGVVRVEAS